MILIEKWKCKDVSKFETLRHVFQKSVSKKLKTHLDKANKKMPEAFVTLAFSLVM